ncbi:MAG: hypothetical protein EA404_07230 [Spirochaetaceae bacterium]|nr:MAG: hypothetical protein EA404_07230 [Spirochaetaceae bacterium]
MSKRTIRLFVVTAVLVAAAMATGCSSGPQTTLEDSGRISYQVQTSSSGEDYEVHRLVIYRDDYDSVELGVLSPNDGSPNSYVLSVVYSGSQWRFMEGEVLVRVGAQLLRLRDNRPTRAGGHNEPVRERLTVALSREQFHSITAGSRVAVEYHPGTIAYVDRRAERAMRRFYQEYADA